MDKQPGAPVSKEVRAKLQGENAPRGFQGGITEGESWKICPYNSSHIYLRAFDHLSKCRTRYTEECKAKGQEVDILICKYDWQHHVPRADIVLHEVKCANKEIINRYLRDYRIRLAYKLLLTPDPKDEYDDPRNYPHCLGSKTPKVTSEARVSDVNAFFYSPPTSASEITVVRSGISSRGSSSSGFNFPYNIGSDIRPEPSSSRGLGRGGRGCSPGLPTGNEASSEASSFGHGFSRGLGLFVRFRSEELGSPQPFPLFRPPTLPNKEFLFTPSALDTASLISNLSQCMADLVITSDSSNYSCVRKVVPKMRKKNPTAENF